MTPENSTKNCPPHPLLDMPDIAYGGDYNPEQWDEATFREDLALMQDMGVNLVSLGIFSWARLEPVEGTYDFTWLEHIIDGLHQAGIRVDLATGTASPPAWMAAAHREILPVTAQGVRLGFGSRQHTCITSPYLRQKHAALAGALAERFGNHPAVIMWHVGNEYSCHVWECFCEACAAAFRGWLQERYTSLEGLNAAWGTAFWSQQYTQWDHICPPAAMPTFHNPSQMLDWRRFCDHQILGMFLNEKQAIRAHSQAPITTNFMGAHLWIDHWKWAKHVDIVSNDAYPDPADPAAAWEWAWNGDLERGLAAGPWMLMEQSPSAVQWRPRNSPKRPGQFALWSLSSLARGAESILQFQWRQSVAGSETFHAGMIPHSGRASRTFSDVRAFGQLLPSLSPIRGTHSTAQCAVVVDWESEWARQSAIGPVDRGEHFAEAKAWHRTLWEAGYSTDIVSVDADFSAYLLIIVPGIFIDYPHMAQALQAAASNGAQVLVTATSAVVDANNHALTGGYGGSLRGLLGIHVIDHYALTGTQRQGLPTSETSPIDEATPRDSLVNRISRAVGTPGAQTWLGVQARFAPLEKILDRMGKPTPTLRGGMWAEEISLYLPKPCADDPQDLLTRAYPDLWVDSDVEAVGLFDGTGGGSDLAGRAAITRRQHGKGAAWYVATDLDGLSRAALVKLLATYARVRPVLDDLPDGVEAICRGEALFILNHSDRAVELSGIVGRDLVSGNDCTGHVMLAPRSGMVIH